MSSVLPMPDVPHTEPAGQLQTHFYLDQIAGWSNNNIVVGWHLNGHLERDVLERTVDDLFARHEALRTTCVRRGAEVLQCIWPPRRQSITELHLRSVGSMSDSEATDALMDVAAAPFDMSRALTRCVLAHAGPDERVLLIVMSHAVVDGASRTLLDLDFRACLAARMRDRDAPPPVPASTQYRDYVAWERTVDLGPHVDFWQSRVAETTLRAPRSVATGDPIELHMAATPAVTAATNAQLHELAARCGTTLPFVLFAAVAVMFTPWSMDALRLGVIHANRVRPTFKPIVGPLASILPLRVRSDPEASFPEIVERVRHEWSEARPHLLPRGALHTAAGSSGWSCDDIIDVLINYFPYDGMCDSIVGHGDRALTIARYEAPLYIALRCGKWDGSRFPCTVVFNVDANGALTTTLAAPPVLSGESLDALGTYIHAVLARIANAPESAVKELVRAAPTFA